MQNSYVIQPGALDLWDLTPHFIKETKISLSAEAVEKIQKCRAYLEGKLSESDALYYGINTGFGSLCNIRISKEDTDRVQYNLVISHACGTGDIIPPQIARIMLFLKIQNLSNGFSGIRLETVERMIELFNQGVTPVIYEQGSLGASGDLAPLAHLGLALIGLGKVHYKGEIQDCATVLDLLGLKPLILQAKEGLAILNGTQFSTGIGVHLAHGFKELLYLADTIGALSADAYNCRISPFKAYTHIIRPHAGQLASAKNIMALLDASDMKDVKKTDVQDPYAFRCMPQVHGASRNALDHIASVLQVEINATTDNPLLFPDEDEIISGGNFHAQPIALPLDYLAIAVAELGSISERRIYQLISGKRDLPTFLAPEPGLNSGFMIAQYTAASIVSQSKQYCTPASVDSIVSCNGQEDHVSMAANAATKANKVVENTKTVIAIELLLAAQAMEFRRPHQTAPILEKLITEFRKDISFMEKDSLLYEDIHRARAFLFS